jgi:hypothetical protein
VPAIARRMWIQVSAGVSRVLVLVLLLGVAFGQSQAPAQAPAQVQKPKPASKPGSQKTDPELQALLEGAATAPPEFGADVMIRLAESNKMPDSAAKIKFLMKAFDLAAAAEQPVKRAGVAGDMIDLRTMLVARAYRLNLDKLSLQSRAVTDLLPLNAAKARELFEQIQFPALAPVGCGERFSYDLDLFYQALAKVASTAFTAKEKEKGRPIGLLAPFVSTLQSHAQVKPVAELLVNAKLSASDIGQLANTFAASLAQLRGDERSFAAAMGPGGANVSGAMSSLIAALEEKEVSSVALLRAYRQYLVSNFGDAHCASMRGQMNRDIAADPLPQAVQSFNQQFRRELQTAQIPPITVDDLKNARIIAPAPPAPYWQSPESKHLQAEMRKLRYGNGDDSSTGGDKPAPAPASQVTDFLTQLEAWQPDNEPAVDVFHQKSTLYENLLDLVSTGPQRSQVIDSFVQLLQQNSGQLPSRIEWFLPADDLLSGKRAGDAREEVIQAFLNSGDPILGLYARLERWEPRKAQDAGSAGRGSWR